MKRNLPHADLIGYYQFLTFRTHDSIDEYLIRIANENISTSLQQYKANEYLDRSLNGAYLNGEVLKYLSDFFKEKDKELYELVAFTIMPNHVHLLFKQTMEIGETVKRLKGSSSVVINRMLNRAGRLWEKSYFDKAIRDEAHFETVYKYIANNAIKADLYDAKERFYGIYG
jgi:REP element-mobilizing transposase RayT